VVGVAKVCISLLIGWPLVSASPSLNLDRCRSFSEPWDSRRLKHVRAIKAIAMPTIRPPIEPPTAAPTASLLPTLSPLSWSAEELAAAATSVDTLLENAMTAGSVKFRALLRVADDVEADVDPDEMVDIADVGADAPAADATSKVMSLYWRTSGI
jgi:hypothetical protein